MKSFRLLKLALIFFLTANVYAQFVLVDTGIPNIASGDASWGDYDNDGDLDLILAGFTSPNVAYTEIFRNDSSTFTNINANIVQAGGPVEWGDYDGDGDLDFFLGGYHSPFDQASARVYRNDSGSFTNIRSLDPILAGDAEWGDYDNDGDLDLIYAGDVSNSSSADITRLYRNDNGTLVTSGISFPGYTYGSVSWGDYDNDGDLDLLFTGESGSFPDNPTRIYKNTNGNFSAIELPIPKYMYSAAAWCDYDNDGDLDFAISGAVNQPNYEFLTNIYRNDEGVFINIDAGLEGTEKSSLAWGDYDNDGDADLIYVGEGNSYNLIRLCRNDNGTFISVSNSFAAFEFGALVWLDYDNNGTLDLFETGGDYGPYYTRLYKNIIATNNTQPNPPANPSVEFGNNSMTFYWEDAIDSETPSSGLSYNIQIGTNSGNGNIMPGNSLENGYRKIIGIGNGQKLNSWTINNLPSNYVYFKVQAIDPSFSGSSWTTILFTPVELSTFTCEVGTDEVILNWTTETELNNSGFEVQRSISDQFVTIGFKSGEGTTTKSNNYQFIDKSISMGTYHYRLKQIDYNGNFQYSNIIAANVLGIKRFSISQNQPNPFNPTTIIKYELPQDSKVQITVYDILGNEVAELVNEEKPAGSYEVNFNASNLASGIYFYKLQAGNFVQTKKMILLK